MEKPMEVSRLAWTGCKVTNAVALWLAFWLKLPVLILVPLLTHGVSALFGPRRAPLLVLYDLLNKVIRTPRMLVDEHALRFAHIISALVALCGLALILLGFRIGYAFVFFLAVAVTLGALGFCTATKLYGCLTSGTCCVRKPKTPR
jgi:hypothetical protein